MNNYVRIRDIAIYHPDKLVENDVYLEHFKKQGKDVRKIFEQVYIRDKRYEIDPNAEKQENTMTMLIEAAKRVLEKTSLEGADMDMIVVATQIPEYVVPACAVMLHRAIEGKRHCFCYDINANCASMLLALENTYRYFESNPNVQKILIVGGEYVTRVQDPNNEMGYGAFGDGACAIILERCEEEAGLMDSDFFINDTFYDVMVFPRCGMSHIYESGEDDIVSAMGGVDCDLSEVAERLENMLAKHHLTKEDISMFCFSQFVGKNVNILRQKLNITEEKSIYIGTEFGYTGSTSPFFVLNRALEQKKIKRGDYVMYWTVGAGMQHFMMLTKY